MFFEHIFEVSATVQSTVCITTFFLYFLLQFLCVNSFLPFPGSGAIRGSYRSSVDGEGEVGGGYHHQQHLPRAALYLFVDKAQMKGIKVDSHPKADFIPVEYPEPRRIKTAFKKLLRACHPSAVPQVVNHCLICINICFCTHMVVYSYFFI